MNIIVCMKQTPDTETLIRLKDDKTDINREGVNYIINPYDEFSIEEAIRIKEKFGEGNVTLISIGNNVTEQLRKGIAMGADNAISIWDDSIEVWDSSIIAKILAKAIGQIPFDIVFCGRQAIDDDASQVGARVAALLNIPQVCVINKLEIADDKKTAVAHRMIEGGTEVLETSLPALFTSQKGLNEPRYPTISAIMKSKKKEIKNMSLADLGLNQNDVDKSAAKLKMTDMDLPLKRQAGKIIEMSDNAVETLVKLLKEEAKVI